MKLWVNILVQVVGTLAQSANVFTSYVPDKYKPLVMLGLTLAQGTVAVAAHYYNPDGSTVPPEKR